MDVEIINTQLKVNDKSIDETEYVLLLHLELPPVQNTESKKVK